MLQGHVSSRERGCREGPSGARPQGWGTGLAARLVWLRAWHRILGAPLSLPGGGRAKVGWVWTDPGFWGVTIQPSIPPHDHDPDPACALCSAECRDICENLHPWVRGLGEPDLGQIIRLSIEGSSKLNTHVCHLSQGFGVIAVVHVPLSSALGSQWLLPCLFAEV